MRFEGALIECRRRYKNSFVPLRGILSIYLCIFASMGMRLLIFIDSDMIDSPI